MGHRYLPFLGLSVTSLESRKVQAFPGVRGRVEVPVAIVGGGVMGLAAAWALGKRGVRSAVLDPLPRRTERNASNDESKIFRHAYGDRADYMALAAASLTGWRALEAAARRPLLETTGLLLLARSGASFAAQTAHAFPRAGLDAPVLEAEELARSHPAFAGFERAVLDPTAGILDPPAILESLEAEATSRRARILRGAHVQAIEGRAGAFDIVIAAGRIRAERVIVAAGYRAPLLLPELAPLLKVSRQPEFAFACEGPAWRPPALPIFAAFEDGFYGFPSRQGAAKVADHRKGAAQPWEPPMTPPSAAEEQSVRAWLAGSVPGLSRAPLARSRLCFYDNTPDEDFLLGPHPAREGVLLAVGFSGHGFKFAPAVGEALAQWCAGEEPSKAWASCDPRRLLRA